MRFVFIALAASVAAIQVTYPSKDAAIDLSKPVTIRWTSVSSDPGTFAIHLVNDVSYPPVDDLVADSVNTAAGSYVMKGVTGVSDGFGYQINLISTDPQNSGILAQSQQFNVTRDSPSAVSSSSTTTSAPMDSSSTGSVSSTASANSSSSTSTGAGGAAETSTGAAAAGAAAAGGPGAALSALCLVGALVSLVL